MSDPARALGNLRHVTRTALRAAATTATALLLVTAAATAAGAAALDDGEVPGEPLGVLRTLLLFVVVPATIYGVITLLAMLPSMVRGGGKRYRPASGWSHDPVWFAGPDDPAAAVAAADRSAVPTGQTPTQKGGASGEW